MTVRREWRVLIRGYSEGQLLQDLFNRRIVACAVDAKSLVGRQVSWWSIFQPDTNSNGAGVAGRRAGARAASHVVSASASMGLQYR